MNHVSAVKNRVLSAQAREIIYSVLKFTQQEAEGNVLLIELSKVQERVAALTGLSLSSVRKIAKEGHEVGNGETPGFSTPNKRQKKSSKIQLDPCDQSILRRQIYDFHLRHKQVPTIKKIHQKFVNELNYAGSRESMRMEFHKLGFRWKKTVDNRKMLIEKHEIRHLRLQYLRNIKEARNANKFIVFTDKTYLLTSHIAKNNLCDTSNNGLKKPVSKGQRLIIVGAGNEQGFVPGSYVRWKSTSKSGDYYDDMNYANFKKGLEKNLLCNLPPNSVIVLDNAPYHNTQEDKCPTSASKKCVMQEWLRERNIAYTASMLKPDLYNIIELHKPRYVKYAIDRIIRAQGHDVFRLSPYHPDLNPIEMVWAALKSYVGARNVDFTFTSIQQLSDEFFETFPVEEWKKITDKVIATERELMSKEPLIDVVVDRIVINPDEDSDSDDLQLNSDSENSELDI
ncbi:uncharacterized protein [Diabrotica undecimpunctata]|uniref:uncharacterized protein n=1 Tax=Diabrotica undecimpunctata TaxID=50387 RepID=UPI003B637CF0